MLAIPLAMLLLVQTASLYALNRQANITNGLLIFPSLIIGIVALFFSLFYLLQGSLSDTTPQE